MAQPMQVGSFVWDNASKREADMKKVLYGTTALVAVGAMVATPAAAEEGVQLGLGEIGRAHV